MMQYYEWCRVCSVYSYPLECLEMQAAAAVSCSAAACGD